MPKEKNISLPTDAERLREQEDQALKAQLVIRTMPANEEEKAVALEPLVESPALTRLMLRNARRSFNEISAMTGIPATEVAERLVAILDNKSWRDDLMEEKLLLAEIGMQIDDIRERSSRYGIDDEAWASMQRVQLAAIKTILEQVDKRRKAVDGQLKLVTSLQAELMFEAFKIARDRAILSIERKFPDMDTDIIYAEFDEALPGALEYLQARADD